MLIPHNAYSTKVYYLIYFEKLDDAQILIRGNVVASGIVKWMGHDWRRKMDRGESKNR